MNLLLISDCEESGKIANDLWQLNTNYTVLQCSDLKNKMFLDYIKGLEGENITYILPQHLQRLTINETIDFCNKYNYLPIVLVDGRKNDGHICYLALEDYFHEMLEYTINEKNEDYEEFLKICETYMKGNKRNDNTVQTSGGRKKLSSKK